MPRILINPIGGLANRMRAIASGISLAHELEYDYIIIWYRNWELNARFDEIFKVSPELKGRIKYPNTLEYYLIYSDPRKKNVFITEITSKFYFSKALRDTTPEIIDWIRNKDYDKIRQLAKESLEKGRDLLIQSGLEFYPYSLESYRHLFAPSQTIEEKVRQVMASLGGHSIGIHIRRTDNTESIKYSPDELFEQEMDYAIKKQSDIKFYLATDNESTKKKFKERYGDRVIFNAAKADRGSVSGIVEAATEMIILSKTNKIIGSYYSSFSEAAAALGGNEFYQVHTKNSSSSKGNRL